MNKPATRDAQIVAEVLAGRTSAFDELVHRYRAALRRVASSRLGCDDTAEDVVQETFLCAFRSLPSYDPRFNFRTWLWTILLNQCRRHYRQALRRTGLTAVNDRSSELVDGRPVRGVAGEEPASDELGPSSWLLAKEQNEQLHQLLQQLSDVQADALRLRFFGGLKYQEIADAMACSLSTAKNRVRWGLAKMSQLIEAGESRDLPTPDRALGARENDNEL